MQSVNNNRKAIAGSNILGYSTTLLTDASAVFSQVYDCQHCRDIIVDVDIDKGATVVITPVLSSSDATWLGKAGDTVTIADSGSTERAIYQNICANKVKVVVTKTEAGSATKSKIVISGQI